jgi:hypothetical protein
VHRLDSVASLVSEVDTDLAAEDKSVVDFARRTRPDYVLKIRLKEGRALMEIEPVG